MDAGNLERVGRVPRELPPGALAIYARTVGLVPAGRIVSALIHSGHPDDIESVMIDGQFVMRNRKILTMNEDSIIREADAVGRRIWSRVLEANHITAPRLPRQP
jgi:5-methylthioadenosine/S-adenosylhomocysteine deaminase